jgi:hypothetical protein
VGESDRLADLVVRDAADGDRLLLEMFVLALGGLVFTGLVAVTTWIGESADPWKAVMWVGWVIALPGWLGLFARIRRKPGFRWGRFLLRGAEQREAIEALRGGIDRAVALSGRRPVWSRLIGWMWWGITACSVVAIAGLFSTMG